MPKRLRFIVPPGVEGLRLDRFLRDLDTVGDEVDSTLLIRILEAGGIFVNRARIKSRHHRLNPGDRIEIHPAPIHRDPQLKLPTIPILYLDDGLVIVNKPAGLPVEPTRQSDRHTLLTAVLQSLPKGPGLGKPPTLRALHRLDREVSGAVALSLHRAAHRKLVPAFSEHRAQRVYLAITQAAPPEAQGILRHRLKKGPRGKRLVLPPDGAENQTHPLAITHYHRLVSAPSGVSLVRLHLETGRTHQIRAQMAAVGAPLYGDRRYGTAPPQGAPALDRIALHAHILSLSPYTPRGGTLRVTAPWPPELAELGQSLGLPPLPPLTRIPDEDILPTLGTIRSSVDECP